MFIKVSFFNLSHIIYLSDIPLRTSYNIYHYLQRFDDLLIFPVEKIYVPSKCFTITENGKSQTFVLNTWCRQMNDLDKHYNSITRGKTLYMSHKIYYYSNVLFHKVRVDLYQFLGLCWNWFDENNYIYFLYTWLDCTLHWHK